MSHWPENMLAVLFIAILLPIIIYWNSQSAPNPLWQDEYIELDYHDHDEYRRMKRAVGVFQNIYGQFQSVQDCCKTPPLLPNPSLQKCNSAAGSFEVQKSEQRGQLNPQSPAPQSGKRIVQAQRIHQPANAGGGLFGALRTFFNRGRNNGRRKRQLSPSTTTADPNLITATLNPNSVITSFDPNSAITVDPNSAITVTVDPNAFFTVTADPNAFLTVTADPNAGFFTALPIAPVDPMFTAPVQPGIWDTATQPPVTVGPWTTLGSPRPVLQSFGIQAVCYADCVFRDLKLLDESNNVKVNEAATVFVNNLPASIQEQEQMNKWYSVVVDAVTQCTQPTINATPTKIQMTNGRVCSTRPIIFSSCVKRYLILNCPKINKSQKCMIKIHQLKKTNIFNLG